MAHRHFVVVVYDISNDKRRTRLHKRLKDFGTPVQYSVFECILDAEGLEKMRAVVRRTIRPRVDHVRFYTLCNACRKKVAVTGRREVTDAPDIIVI
ncbi:MAG: CRISPR-associated endonuclease Cas2 [Anaerolineales bacterium]